MTYCVVRGLFMLPLFYRFLPTTNVQCEYCSTPSSSLELPTTGEFLTHANARILQHSRLPTLRLTLLSRRDFYCSPYFLSTFFTRPWKHQKLLRHNHHSQTARLSHHTPCQSLQAQTTQSSLTMLYLCNLVNMLQANSPHRTLYGVSVRRAVRARLALLAVVVVHWTGDISCAANLGFDHGCTGRGEEECRGRGGPQGECERAVRADGDASGDGSAGYVVGGASVELLVIIISSDTSLIVMGPIYKGCAFLATKSYPSSKALGASAVTYFIPMDSRKALLQAQRFQSCCAIALLTLQKSILFTPFEPKAGPTGGDGLACPAPTISLTIWSLGNALFAMIMNVLGYLRFAGVDARNFCGGRCGAGRHLNSPIGLSSNDERRDRSRPHWTEF